ncbi:MAG: energy-coupling factor transporter ATPase [Proteocatella sp.]|jgi:energy-coupling factor transport system ATP-binding protein|nr:energy-coupling factor transporter ATPase [Proteocatella sp.]MBP9659288.1 energy-coupling factor transporter ATPase [Proteocatella sp.]
MSEIVRVENLVFRYDDEIITKNAVDDVSLNIEEGEFVVIIGHNGSGKSTLAKHFNGIFYPTQGDVYIKGMNTKDDSLIWEIRQKAGMVFQNPDNQIVATIVEEDVAFGPENLGIEKSIIRKRVDEALALVNMTEFAKKQPHNLSGGQKQRVAIAGIIAMRPDCIIFDEPTAMLDPSGRKEVIDTILKLNKEEGKTIIHITHFMDEATNADRVIVMDEGKITMQGKPREIFARVEELNALGLDVPQMTELSYELGLEGVRLREDILTVEEMVDELCQLL